MSNQPGPTTKYPVLTMCTYDYTSSITSGGGPNLYGITPWYSATPTLTSNPVFVWDRATVMDEDFDIYNENIEYKNFSFFLLVIILRYHTSHAHLFCLGKHSGPFQRAW